MIILSPQFLDRCKQGCWWLKFHKKGTEEVRVSAVFSCQKMKNYNIWLAELFNATLYKADVTAMHNIYSKPQRHLQFFGK